MTTSASLSLSLSLCLSLSDLAAVADDEIGLVTIRGYCATAPELASAVDDVLVQRPLVLKAVPSMSSQRPLSYQFIHSPQYLV